MNIRIKKRSFVRIVSYISALVLVLGVFCAIAVYPIHILAAGLALAAPPFLSVLFIRKFVAEKPRYFFWFWLDEKLQGRFLRKPERKGGGYAAAS